MKKRSLILKNHNKYKYDCHFIRYFSILGTDFTSRSSGQRCPLPWEGMIGPLAMLISGMLIAGTTPQEILAFPHIGLVTILRLIGVPLLTILLLKFSGLASFAENGSQILLVTLLATITPSASTITQMAQVYGKDARYAGAINVITTLLCMITMPIMVYLYQL